HICTVYEFDEAEEKTFISMSYIEGRSLKKKLESGPLGQAEALQIAIQVAEGLNEAHKKGVVHRDIKSANIMVTEKGQAKIMDFGLARMTGGTLLTQEGMAMGTIAYMSPEQARGEKVDHRTDIWSFGVALYEMLSGQLPFKGEHDQAVIYSVLNERPEPVISLRPDVPESLDQVVRKALEKNTDKRYQHMQELLEDLKSVSEGIVPEEIKARLRKQKLLKKKKGILYAGIAGFLIILTVTVLILFTGRAEAMDSIAVLPVDNLSGDPGQEYFSDGMTDALINELSKISSLRVISRQSVMRYKRSEKSVSEIAKELGVKVVVEASVLTAGNRVQMRTQLIQAASERNLWAQSYEREISDILILQSEMAQAITHEIRIKMTPQEEALLTSARRVDPEAYEAYLKGQFHWYKLTRQDLDTALQYFELAREKDPNYALAYSGIASVWIGFQQQGLVPSSEAGPKAKAAALKALELDDTLAEVHDTLAGIKAWTDWDWEGGETEYRRSIELNPNYPDARASYSHLLSIMRRPDEAMAQIERVMDLDPLNVLFRDHYAMILMYAHRYDEAVNLLREILKISPDDWVALAALRTAFHLKKMYPEALEIWKRSYAAKGDHEAEETLMRGYQEGGYQVALQRVAEMMEVRSHTTFVTPWQIGTLYTRAGKYDKALDWLEKAYEAHDPNMPYISVDPIFDDMRSDLRFKDLLRRMNLPLGD
ncbi:MAG: protein kinase, partial [Candidatus Aminicenantes bacterium]|nr:protein kinase [Candidatus Aminicenantes bacterium]